MFDIVITMSLHISKTSAENDGKHSFSQRKEAYLAAPYTSTSKKP